jgi:hypothetical protein
MPGDGFGDEIIGTQGGGAMGLDGADRDQHPFDFIGYQRFDFFPGQFLYFSFHGFPHKKEAVTGVTAL